MREKRFGLAGPWRWGGALSRNRGSPLSRAPLQNHLLFWAPLKAGLDPSQGDEGRGTQVLKVLQTEIAHQGAALDVQSDAWREPENAAQRELGILSRAENRCLQISI